MAKRSLLPGIGHIFKALRLRSGQAPSTALRAGPFDCAQGRPLRLGSGQAPAGIAIEVLAFFTSLAFHKDVVPSTALRAGLSRTWRTG